MCLTLLLVYNPYCVYMKVLMTLYAVRRPSHLPRPLSIVLVIRSQLFVLLLRTWVRTPKSHWNSLENVYEQVIEWSLMLLWT